MKNGSPDIPNDPHRGPKWSPGAPKWSPWVSKIEPGDPKGVRATPTWQINGGRGGIDLPCGGFLRPFCLTAHPAHAAHAKTHMPAQLHAHACTCPHMPKKMILVEVFACTCLRLLPHMPHSPPRTCPHSRTAHAAHAFGPTRVKCIPQGLMLPKQRPAPGRPK